MAAPVVQSSFSAGELSPHLFGRVDLSKYKIGAARMHNFIVDYRGGAGKRPGTKFVGKTPHWWSEILLIPFQFNTDQTYMLEFGHGYVRVVTRGGYVVDANSVIYQVTTGYTSASLKLLKWTQSGDTVTLVHPDYPTYELVRYGHADWRFNPYTIKPSIGQVQSIAMTAHSSGYIDPAAAVYVNYAYGVTAVAADGSESLISPLARLFNTLDMSAHRVNMVVWWGQWVDAQYYNVYKATSGVNAQLPDGTRMGFVGSTRALSFNDSNILPNYTRSPPIHTDPFAPGQITRVVITQGGLNYSYGATITISDPTGYGAIITPIIVHGSITGGIIVHGGQNYTSPQVTVSQSSGSGIGSGAAAYAEINYGFGGIGNPGPITGVYIQAYGSGYNSNTHVQVLDALGTGHGAVVYPSAFGGNGEILSIVVQDGGADYQEPYVTFTPNAAPSNAAGYAEVGPGTGTYPGAVAYFQQRLLFAASRRHPSTLWGSKPGAFHNFDVGIPITDGDAFEFTLASQQINAIKYMLPMPGGLVILTAGGAWQLSGTQQFAPVTPTAMMATPQAFNGCGDLPPITIGYEILFLQSAESVVRNLSYNFFANIYTGADLTVLSSHLFVNYRIVSWCYAEEPDKVIWAVRDDGALLSLTFLKEQEVAGWAEHSTAGLVKAVGCVREGAKDVVYMAVERVDGTGNRYTAIEQLQHRSSRTIEDSWFLDCALATVPYVGQDIMYSGPLTDPNNIILFLRSQTIFSPDLIAGTIRVAGGKFQITGIYAANAVFVKQIVAPTDTYLIEETGVEHIRPQPAGSWTIAGYYTYVTGLSHLEGMTVSVMVDGKVQTDKVVTSGSIWLDSWGSKVMVGLGFDAELQTLRLESQPSIQSRRKKIPALTVRVADSRGLWAGMTWKTLTEIKELAPSVLSGDTPSLYTGDLRIVMDPLWDAEGQVCIRSVNALPANIVAVIPEAVLGDD